MQAHKTRAHKGMSMEEERGSPTRAWEKAQRGTLLEGMTESSTDDPLPLDGDGAYATSHAPKEWETTPLLNNVLLKKLIMTIIVCCMLGMVYTISVLAMVPAGIGYTTVNEPTRIKNAAILGMMDTSVSPCTDVERYACGAYMDQNLDLTSLFLQTQLGIVRATARHVPYTWNALIGDLENATILPPPSDLYSLGFYGCVDVEINADYTQHDRLALYLSAPCWDGCPPTRHPLPPTLVDAPVPSFLPVELRDYINMVMDSGARVYWFPPDMNTMTVWDFTCNVTAEEQYNHYIRNTGVLGLVDTYYHIDFPFDTPDITALIAMVRGMVVDYILSASFLVTTSAKNAFIERIKTIPIHVGGGTTALYERCDTTVDLPTCMALQWQILTNAIVSGVVVNADELWPMSMLDVNACYDPLTDVIYVPAALLQSPLFSIQWPEWQQMASVGAIVAHEMGHAIRPVWSFPVHLAQEDTRAVSDFEDCLMHYYAHVGMSAERNTRTLSENWADAVGYRTMLRYARRQTMSLTHDCIVLYVQMFCSAGGNYTSPNSTDDHSTSYMRSNATASVTAFGTAMHCPTDPTLVC